MAFRLPAKLVFVLCSLFFCQATLAISLGALSITSAKEERLEAKIMILMSAKEVKTLGKLEAQLADSVTFEKFLITRPNDELLPRLSIQKDGTGRPIAIQIQFSKNVLEIDKAFNDLVIELSWSSGKLTRVYTILNTQAQEMQVQQGDSLQGIASQIAPQLAGVEFNQVLVALYRLNPKAFYAGNIHRLKQGETLTLPSASMVASIPAGEAQEFAVSAAKDFRERQLNRSSDATLKNNNRTYPNAIFKDDFKDRLKIGSSQTESEQALAQAKFNEDFIAQQKMLEQAQQRISELERNIADLQAVNSNKILGLPKLDAAEYGILFGILSLTGIFFYGILRRSKPYEVDVARPMKSEAAVEEMQGQKNMEAVATILFTRPDEKDKSTEDPEVLLDSEVTHSAEHAMPKNVQALFSSIDLNLGPSSVSPVKPDQTSVDLIQSENPIESSATLSKVLLNSDEQKVRLNLARSYIKIKDFETARILLSDLIEQGANVDQEVISQASSLLLEIS